MKPQVSHFEDSTHLSFSIILFENINICNKMYYSNTLLKQ